LGVVKLTNEGMLVAGDIMTQVNLNASWKALDIRVDEIANAERTALNAHFELVKLCEKSKESIAAMPLYERLAIDINKNQLTSALRSLVSDYPEIANGWKCLQRYAA